MSHSDRKSDHVDAEKMARYARHRKQPNLKLFVIKDDLWVWHIPGPDLLCFSCAEKALGRPFQAEDFNPLAINRWVLDLLEKRAIDCT